MVRAAVWIGDDSTVSERHCRGGLPADLADQYGVVKGATGVQVGEAAQAGVVLSVARWMSYVFAANMMRCSGCLGGRAGGQRLDVLGVQRLAADAPVAATDGPALLGGDRAVSTFAADRVDSLKPDLKRCSLTGTEMSRGLSGAGPLLRRLCPVLALSARARSK